MNVMKNVETNMLPGLNRDEIARYSRHLLLNEVGMRGQQKLKAASVLVVGAGGLGSPVALYLAAAGIGHIGVVDPDVVDISNLQRQVIHSSSGQGQSKAESARARMLEINPTIEVTAYPNTIHSANALDISESYDILVDGTDNLPARYLLSDLAVLTGKPYVYGSIFRFEGQVSVFGIKDQPCYRCLFPEPPPPGMIPSCAEAGVMGVLPGTIGTLQATEVIKLITGVGKSLAGRLLLYDALEMSFDIVNLRRRKDCKTCGDKPEITDLIDNQLFCGLGPESDPSAAGSGRDIEPAELHDWLKTGRPFSLIDIREPFERELSNLPGSISIPAADFPAHLGEFPADQPIVLFCRNGMRSARLVKQLNPDGAQQILNLHGGINAYIDQFDSKQSKY